MEGLAAVILAAGKGTRMKSRLPKVLHPVGGQPMVSHVMAACRTAGAQPVVLVIGHGAEQVQATLGPEQIYVEQKEQLGTGHAVMQAETVLRDFEGDILVVCGDTPLLRGETLAALAQYHRQQEAVATVLTMTLANPTGYGRIIRDEQGQVAAIVEEKDATPEQKAIREVNSGTYCFQAQALFAALQQITPNNAQGEYYLTDVLAIFRQQGQKVAAWQLSDDTEVMGINDRVALAEANRLFRERINRQQMLAGVTILDPATTYIEAEVKIGADTVIYPNTHLTGKTTIGAGCQIGPDTKIMDSQIGDGVEIQFSVVLQAEIGNDCTIGPFAYLRPGTHLAAGVKVGDFVEIKNAVIGQGSKVPHLSYIGDAEIGSGVNIGAGTITCNYDGYKKSKTIIGDGAFIGSNSNLVAPVTIGAGSLVAAGSTIVKDVPADALGVARAPQKNREGWAKARREAIEGGKA
ncbi:MULTISPECIES: bifunctional UDP-N-acetylglucosamine diphosphorylase/glucosamine-1-phosphate N-acetyltransferase GlmU [unclassified Carboxydocella]|uniref:bifunctional UDP-N-acetylglucosamine diphosphorylase/glucosamine-1-phosphate N-acetyltransferase GlmU n=1 Tax=unclassified Carboxydocella TaxID=2685367 RepID=UPI0009AEB253|nr:MULTISPECIES: bifunctional UDP-N-acetylglucosamine diphosphorylase/glucosamine-1-phosphate N-acetyltransferase GlmU [unclassified Carboxydocella]GAW29854.1 bifunctional N-acetylglucosamine-1-phosphate uridyltransferase/glucosamine-1-phosphate acetyltransferase [Carboxydocella sp. ULO1]GAW32889.1 bifunctional N-acetylglucosamine-1-phosphate uridyltransferase/glucosamine-1-phosphate acetyltransferase [Carboxydocella sp. JDF658]